jgi:phage gp29-like protein
LGPLAQIAQRFERAAGSLTRGGRASVTAPPPLWTMIGRIGGELTPHDLSNIMLMADTGMLFRLIDLACEAREKDCHLHACLSTFELSLAGLELQIIPATDKRKDRKIAAEVERILNDFGSFNETGQPLGLSDLIHHLASGYYFGHAVDSLDWVKQNGKLIPTGATPVQARRFIVDPLSTKLHFYDHFGNIAWPGLDLLEEFPNRYIQFLPRVIGSGPSREGLMRPLLWAALFRSWGIRDWMALAELAWKPWRIGKYDKDQYASDADIRALVNALDFLTTNGSTMLPNNVQLEVMWAGQKGSGHESAHGALCAFMAAEMSKAILGQTMTTEDGSSLSQAQVHARVAADRRDAAARAIANVLRWQIVARFVRLNYGPDTLVPQVKLVANDVDVAQLAEVLVKLCGPKGIGLPVATRWIYKAFGMPVPKPGEEVVGNPMPLRIPTDEESQALGVKMRIRLLEEERDRAAVDEAEREHLAELEADQIRRRERSQSRILLP